jgi:hypothetical protein
MGFKKKSFGPQNKRAIEDFSYGKQSLSSAVSTVELLFFISSAKLTKMAILPNFAKELLLPSFYSSIFFIAFTA